MCWRTENHTISDLSTSEPIQPRSLILYTICQYPDLTLTNISIYESTAIRSILVATYRGEFRNRSLSTRSALYYPNLCRGLEPGPFSRLGNPPAYMNPARYCTIKSLSTLGNLWGRQLSKRFVHIQIGKEMARYHCELSHPENVDRADST